MTYTQLAISMVIVVACLDLFVFRTKLILSCAFWTSYAIILPFQLVSNGLFTGQKIVNYSPEAILGISIVFAPLEDLLFGFALILITLISWKLLGKCGIQREPFSGPPIWRKK